MVKIDSTKFGEIAIGGERYQDVLISGGEIISRDLDCVHQSLGTGHRIMQAELEVLLKSKPDVVIFGNGQGGALTVDEEIKNKIRAEQIEMIILKTPEAAEEFNRLIDEGKKISALMHVTC